MTRRRQKLRQHAREENVPTLFDIPVDNDEDLPTLSDEDVIPETRMRFISFGSGSSGNCAYIGTPDCGLLIDAGVDNNIVAEQLKINNINPATIKGIILTHDHFDHIKFAYSILRRNSHMRLYATPKALKGILNRSSISRRIRDYHQPIYKEFPFKVGPMEITAFDTSHDGTDNSGFFIAGPGANFVVTTDTGIITERADFYMRQANYLMLESNYDRDMLIHGRYKEYLKARIMGPLGHLDNIVAASFVAQAAPAMDLRYLFLCHLSNDNNTPQIALSTMKNTLEAVGLKINVMALPRTDSSPLFVLH